jgi:hypothetical protein
MQINEVDASRKRAPLTRVLSPYRRARLRHDAPHFRDEFVEPTNLDLTVSLVGGANGTLRRLLETGDRG